MNRTHGMRFTVEYQAWCDMINRCYRPKTRRYERYGGRGIKVCRRWLTSFVNFYADVGPRPDSSHTLGRIDNDGHYKPGNVEWQTRSEQNCNKGNARMLTFRGQTLNAKVWARRLGVNYDSVMSRLRRGWSVKRALTEPLHDRGQMR